MISILSEVNKNGAFGQIIICSCHTRPSMKELTKKLYDKNFVNIFNGNFAQIQFFDKRNSSFLHPWIKNPNYGFFLASKVKLTSSFIMLAERHFQDAAKLKLKVLSNCLWKQIRILLSVEWPKTLYYFSNIFRWPRLHAHRISFQLCISFVLADFFYSSSRKSFIKKVFICHCNGRENSVFRRFWLSSSSTSATSSFD